MKELFNKFTNSIIIVSVLAIIAGLLMILYPKVSIETLGIIAACYMIAQGGVSIFLGIKSNKYDTPFDSLLTGFISIISGVVLLSMPESLSVLLTIIVGIYMISVSVEHIKIALEVKKINGMPWGLILSLGIINLIIALLVIFNPFKATIAIEIYIGAMLIAQGILNIINMITLKRKIKDTGNLIREKIALK